MAKTLRVRSKAGWVTKDPADLPENRLLAEEVDDNFLELETAVETVVSDLAGSGGADLVGFQQDGAGAVERLASEKLREFVSSADYGTLQQAVSAMSSGKVLRIVGAVSDTATFDGLTDFEVIIEGSLTNPSSKPAGTGVDDRSTSSGVLSTLKFTDCSRFKISGAGYIDGRYRESLHFSNCSDFTVSVNLNGSGLNDNLVGVYVRYCQRFAFKDMIASGTTLKPPSTYATHSNQFQVWDSSNFVFSGVTSRECGMNGIYIGSNCNDFNLVDSLLEYNAGSGIQLAWSSFGAFPVRWSISNNIIRYNRADGIDVRNTEVSSRDVYGIVAGNVLTYNGWDNSDPTGNTPTADGSGVGTFIKVGRVSIAGNQSFESARAGIYLQACNDCDVSGNLIIKTNTGSVGEGIYIDTCSNLSVRNNNVKTLSTLEALKTNPALNNVVISNNVIDGRMAFATGTYSRCKFIANKCTAYTQVVALFDFIDNEIVVGNASQNGVLVGANEINLVRNYISGTNFGLVLDARSYVNVDNNYVVGGTGGIRVNANSSTIVRGNYGQGESTHGIHFDGACNNCELSMNQGASTSGNSIRVESTCVDTQKWGNRTISSTPSYAGTFGINF